MAALYGVELDGGPVFAACINVRLDCGSLLDSGRVCTCVLARPEGNCARDGIIRAHRADLKLCSTAAEGDVVIGRAVKYDYGNRPGRRALNVLRPLDRCNRRNFSG